MKTRKIALSILAILATLCMAFSVIMLAGSKNPVGAADVAESVALQEEFYVQDGASVRTEKGSSGIRWTTVISKAFYEEMDAKGAKWFQLIEEGTVDEQNITKDTSDIVKAIEPEKILLVDDHYEFYTALTFDNESVSEAELVSVYKKNYSARALVACEETGIIYSYADENTDTTRNIVDVAEKVLVQDKTEEGVYDLPNMAGAKAILQKYIAAKTAIVPFDTLGYVEDMYIDDVDTLYIPGLADGEYTFKIAGKVFHGVVKDGSFVLAGTDENPLALTLGNTYVAEMVDENDTTYAFAFKYVSKIIDNAEEYLEVYSMYMTSNQWANTLVDTPEKYYNKSTFTQRYYVLGDSFSYSTKLRPTNYNDYFVWRDVLDGQGYTMTFDEVQTRNQVGGVFNQINGGTIKNLSVKATYTNYDETANYSAQGRFIFSCASLNAKIENCFFHAESMSIDKKLGFWQPFGYAVGINFKDVYIYYGDSISEPESDTSYHGYIGSQVYWGGGEVNCENTHVVSSGLKAAFTNGDGASNQDVATKIPGLYYYQELSSMKVGDWTINADSSAVWGAKGHMSSVNEYASENKAQKRVVSFSANIIDKLGYIEDFYADTADNFSGLGLANGTYDVTINGVTQTITVADGVAEVPHNAFGLTIAEKYTAKFVGEDGEEAYQQIKFVNATIDNEEELWNAVTYYPTAADKWAKATNNTDLTKYYDRAALSARYYVLTTNLIISTKWSTSYTVWHDTFDGQGFSITLKHVQKSDPYGNGIGDGGLFGRVAANVTIKNFALYATITVDRYDADYQGEFVLAGLCDSGPILENVYIHAEANSKLADGTDYAGATAWQPLGYQVTYQLNNVIIHLGDSIKKVEGKSENALSYLGMYNSGLTSNNSYVISKNIDVAMTEGKAGTESAWYAENQTDKTGEKITGLKYFASIDQIDTNQVGDWAIDAQGNVSWAGASLTDLSDLEASLKEVSFASAEIIEPVALKGIVYLEDFYQDEAKKIKFINIPDGQYTMTINGNSYPVTVAANDEKAHDNNGNETTATGQKVTIISQLDLVLGEEYTATFTNENGMYTQRVKYVSDAITEDWELNEFLVYYTRDTASTTLFSSSNDASKFYDKANFSPRYYVLANDIKFDAYSSGTYRDDTINNGNRGIFDILDGQGYKIDAHSNWVGLFNAVGSSAILKNVQLRVGLIGGNTNDSDKLAIAKHIGANATFENMYIDFYYARYSATSTSTANKFGIFCAVASKNEKEAFGFTLKDVYANVADNIIPATDANGEALNSGWISPNDNNLWAAEWKFTNFNVVSKNIKAAIHASNRHQVAHNQDLGTCATCGKAWDNATKVSSGMSYYPTAEAMLGEKAKVGDWTINADGTATWMVSTATLGASDERIQNLELGKTKEIAFEDGITEGIEVSVEGDAVTVDGLTVTAANIGTAIVTVTRGQEVKKFTVIVSDSTASLSAIAENDTIGVGDSTTISIKDISGSTYNGYVLIKAAQDGIVSIGANGKITGLSAGEVSLIVAFQVNGNATIRLVTLTVA